MLDRNEIIDVLNGYETNSLKIGSIASHSALDIFDGAIEEGFRTVAICQQGREKTYSHYFKTERDG